ncbi:MAG: hypothetical protein WDM88_03630 [Galbitalea sp.]
MDTAGVALGDQQAGDEESAQDEERVDPEPPARHRIGQHVEQHNGGDGERPKAVQPGEAR